MFDYAGLLIPFRLALRFTQSCQLPADSWSVAQDLEKYSELLADRPKRKSQKRARVDGQLKNLSAKQTAAAGPTLGPMCLHPYTFDGVLW